MEAVAPQQVTFDQCDSCTAASSDMRGAQASGTRADDQQVVAAHSQPPLKPARFRPARMGAEFRINFQISSDR